jgi:aerobic C4-dicarboxylate transport protein
VNTFQRIIKNLTFWVLLAIIGGIIFGMYYPTQATNLKIPIPTWQESGLAINMKTLGDAFISVIKLFINPIIFLTITLGIASMGDLKRVGRTGGKALIYFEVVTTFALIIGIVVAYVIQPGAGVDTSKALGADVAKYVVNAESFSWIQFFKTNTTIQVLCLSLILGSALGQLSVKQKIIDVLTKVSNYVFRALHFVMYLAPIGAFGGMAFTIGKFGTSALFSLAKLMATVYITMGLFIIICLGLILRMYKISIWEFIKYIKEELLIVLGTSSSESALPALIGKLERMGCEKSIVGLVVPAGYSFNLDGTTIYLSMATIFLAQAYGVSLTMGQIISIIGILMITSKGAAGVTGSGFVVLASTLQAVNIIPLEGLALLLGVDRFMSEARSITNFIGNGVATIWIANHEKAFDHDACKRAFLEEEQEEFYFVENK